MKETDVMGVIEGAVAAKPRRPPEVKHPSQQLKDSKSCPRKT